MQSYCRKHSSPGAYPGTQIISTLLLPISSYHNLSFQSQHTLLASVTRSWSALEKHISLSPSFCLARSYHHRRSSVLALYTSNNKRRLFLIKQLVCSCISLLFHVAPSSPSLPVPYIMPFKRRSRVRSVPPSSPAQTMGPRRQPRRRRATSIDGSVRIPMDQRNELLRRGDLLIYAAIAAQLPSPEPVIRIPWRYGDENTPVSIYSWRLGSEF